MHCKKMLSDGLGAYELDALIDERECEFLDDFVEQFATQGQVKRRTIQKVVLHDDATVHEVLDRCERKNGIKWCELRESIVQRLRTALPDLLDTAITLRLDKSERSVRFVGLGDHLSFSRHIGPHKGLSRHRDSMQHVQCNGRPCPDGCLLKLAINLSSTPIGTAFYADGAPDSPPLVQSSGARGSAILFDMRMWHSGTAVRTGECKKMLGIRLFFE